MNIIILKTIIKSYNNGFRKVIVTFFYIIDKNIKRYDFIAIFMKKSHLSGKISRTDVQGITLIVAYRMIHEDRNNSPGSHIYDIKT